MLLQQIKIKLEFGSLRESDDVQVIFDVMKTLTKTKYTSAPFAHHEDSNIHAIFNRHRQSKNKKRTLRFNTQTAKLETEAQTSIL